MKTTIRPAAAEDAAEIARLEMEFVDYLFQLGDRNPTSLNINTYLKDGFGPNPAFSGFVAEADNSIIGYILYHPGYDIDRGGRIYYVFDLFVTGKYRGQGIGRTLMNSVADLCLAEGGNELVWSVFKPNKSAITFYTNLGATSLNRENMIYMHLKIK
jgi:GNAT superfamily N-acetyltransferase